MDLKTMSFDRVTKDQLNDDTMDQQFATQAASEGAAQQSAQEQQQPVQGAIDIIEDVDDLETSAAPVPPSGTEVPQQQLLRDASPTQ